MITDFPKPKVDGVGTFTPPKPKEQPQEEDTHDPDAERVEDRGRERPASE